MIYKHINGATLWRMIIACGLAGAIGAGIISGDIRIIVIASIFLLISVGEILYYINNVNRKLSFFFDAIRNEDSTLHFAENVKNTSVKELNASLNNLNAMISEIKIRNEYNERFFRELLKYSATGLIAVDAEGYIEIINDSALDIIGMRSLSHIKLLEQKNKELFEAMEQLQQNQTITLKILSGEELLLISIKVTQLQFGQKKFRVYSLYDIKAEMEENELESWQKLIRVLTHEIMNSIAPITSLSKTLSRFFEHEESQNEFKSMSKIHIDNTREGLAVIEETGKGLMHFIDTYRKLTKIPKPVFKPISIEKWLKRIDVLMKERLETEAVNFQIRNDSSKQEVIGDEKLLTQVVINLINNAIDALCDSESKRIRLRVHDLPDSKIQLDVIDNGCGIDKELMDKIFVPFFTTKEQGSGIGLSLSRQIMRMHKGTIAVNTKPGKQTTFFLRF
jgi:nitrogen fixation/metabolism regulation signal transduction histidine kinase